MKTAVTDDNFLQNPFFCYFSCIDVGQLVLGFTPSWFGGCFMQFTAIAAATAAATGAVTAAVTTAATAAVTIAATGAVTTTATAAVTAAATTDATTAATTAAPTAAAMTASGQLHDKALTMPGRILKFM